MSTPFHVGIIEDRWDPLKLGRYRVRVFGSHTESIADIPVNKLPWAIPLSKNASMSGVGLAPNYVEGTLVYIFFQDEDSRQMPVIVGAVAGVPINKITFPGGTVFNEITASVTIPDGNYPESIPPVEPPLAADVPITEGAGSPPVPVEDPEQPDPDTIVDPEVSMKSYVDGLYSDLEAKLENEYSDSFASYNLNLVMKPFVDSLKLSAVLSKPALIRIAAGLLISELIVKALKAGSWNDQNLYASWLGQVRDGYVSSKSTWELRLPDVPFPPELDEQTIVKPTPAPETRLLPNNIMAALLALNRNIYQSTTYTSITTILGHQDFGYRTTFMENTASYALASDALINIRTSTKGWTNVAQVTGGWSTISASAVITIDSGPTFRYTSVSGGVSDIGFTSFGLPNVRHPSDTLTGPQVADFIVRSISGVGVNSNGQSLQITKHLADVEFAYREGLITRDEVYYYSPDLDKILPHYAFPDRAPGTNTV